MAEHCAFGASGGAGCVEDCCQIICLALYGRCDGAGSIACSLKAAGVIIADGQYGSDTRIGAGLSAQVCGVLRADENARCGVGQEVFDLRRGIGGIERQEYGARQDCADIKL